MEKFLVVDGHNLLFQMFYGMPSRIVGVNGKAIQGTLGFVGALLKIIRMVCPTHVVVLFDGDHQSERTALNDEYKANRIDYSTVASQDNPYSQIEDVYRALTFLGIAHKELEEYEVDDVIASYAFSCKCDMIISSFDSDFFQLIDEHIQVLRYRGVKTYLCDVDYVYNKHGVMPSRYADYKSLTGDAADNIKGADKVGPKTAAQLIGEFGSLENVIANAQSIKRPSTQASIIAHANRLMTNYKLIKLTAKAPLPFEMSELCYTDSALTTTQVLKGIGLR